MATPSAVASVRIREVYQQAQDILDGPWPDDSRHIAVRLAGLIADLSEALIALEVTR